MSFRYLRAEGEFPFTQSKKVIEHDFFDWVKGNSPSARRYRKLIEKPGVTALDVAMVAFGGGKRAGLEIAARRIGRVVMGG